MLRTNVMSADFDLTQSPFGVNDVESMSFRLGFGKQKRFKNPNASRRTKKQNDIEFYKK